LLNTNKSATVSILQRNFGTNVGLSVEQEKRNRSKKKQKKEKLERGTK
jgi:hypothetical protein